MILQIIVIAQGAVGIVSFLEIPQGGVDVCPDPLDPVAGVIAGNQAAVAVHRKEFVFFLCLVPDAGIDDYLSTVRNLLLIGHTDLFGGIQTEIILTEHGLFHQIQPLCCVAAVGPPEAVRRILVKLYGVIADREGILSTVGACARDSPEHRVCLIRLR